MAKTLNPLDSMMLGDRLASLAIRVKKAEDFAPGAGAEIRWSFSLGGIKYRVRMSVDPEQ